MTSTQLPFENLYNTRDLGGMTTKDGSRIKSGMLIRSGHLHQGTTADRRWLAEHVSLVIDFRTIGECREKPDPDQFEYIHLPIINEQTAGITREEEADRTAMRDLSGDPEAAKQYMIGLYRNFVSTDYGLQQYRKYVDLLLEGREKAILWHCTAGKDRAGFAAIIIQEILGVPGEDIREDYLKTNICLQPEVSKLMRMAKDETGEKALDYLFGAKEEYFDALYEAIYHCSGSPEAFLTDGLRLTTEEIQTLRATYLE